jgi:hypothetical protein
VAAAGAPKKSDNGLTDDEWKALALQWKKDYAKALDAKKKADTNLKNVGKHAKAELGRGAVLLIKDMMLLDEEDGEEEMRIRLRRQADALRWMSIPIGTQIEFALTPRTERDEAFNEGRRASESGQPAMSRFASTSLSEAYMQGYQAHQAELMGQVGRG